MIDAGDETGTAPFTCPASIGEEITERFGRPPSTEGQRNANAKVDYTQGILREYVLPELQPDVILNWITEPDGTQHETASGSPESVATIRNDDRPGDLGQRGRRADGAVDGTRERPRQLQPVGHPQHADRRGADVKVGETVRVPAGNVDVAPTILAPAAVDDGLATDGRVLSEAFEGGVDEDDAKVRTRTLRTRAVTTAQR